MCYIRGPATSGPPTYSNFKPDILLPIIITHIFTLELDTLLYSTRHDLICIAKKQINTLLCQINVNEDEDKVFITFPDRHVS